MPLSHSPTIQTTLEELMQASFSLTARPAIQTAFSSKLFLFLMISERLAALSGRLTRFPDE
jgi:hypothetical protein